jgi:WD40 repeat protein
LQNENILQLAVVGKDDLRRDVIVIYDITNYFENSFKIFTKQISDFVIRKLSYLDREDPNT